MDRGSWWAVVYGVTKSQTRLSDFTFTFLSHALEKEMATHSSVLVWRIPGTVEPGGLLSMGLHRVGHDWSDLAAAAACSRYLVFHYVLYLLFSYFFLVLFNCYLTFLMYSLLFLDCKLGLCSQCYSLSYSSHCTQHRAKTKQGFTQLNMSERLIIKPSMGRISVVSHSRSRPLLSTISSFF